MMNYKDLAASIELSEYCMKHGYTFTWCHWLEGILFTRRADGSEFSLKAGATAAKVYEAVRDAVANESADPLKDFLEPVKHPSLKWIL